MTKRARLAPSAYRCPAEIPRKDKPSLCDLNYEPCIHSESFPCPWYEDWLFELKQEELDRKGRE